MKTLLFATILTIASFNLAAHSGGHESPLKEWELNSSNEILKARLIRYDQGKVWLSGPAHKTLDFNLSDFSAKDQAYILKRHQALLSLNHISTDETALVLLPNSQRWLMLFGVLLLSLSVFHFTRRKQRLHLSYGVAGVALIFLVSCNGAREYSAKISGTNVPANNLSFLASLFGSFTGVSTTHDDTYFYIASNGLPDHNMMTGITNWQQQVPIAQDYTGDNSWAIPIQPQLVEEPLSTKTNLLKGAIAIAVNGIPIFNPLNNRSEDANAIGELDQWGGHCGRADDYHYHLPPTHLQESVGAGKPIAYAVDGFPVYGETTDELDEYLGKFNTDSSYQYHTISEYPYFIAGMRGYVELDPNTTAPENQVLPQARTKELRPATRPLRGAVITDFRATGENSYSLTYLLESEEYVISYSWDSDGLYTYQFIKPDGTSVTETYQK